MGFSGPLAVTKKTEVFSNMTSFASVEIWNTKPHGVTYRHFQYTAQYQIRPSSEHHFEKRNIAMGKETRGEIRVLI